MDLGVANYYMKLIGTDSRALPSILNENYVYINLKKRQDFSAEIAFETPVFSTFKGNTKGGTEKNSYTANIFIGTISLLMMKSR